MIDHNDAPQTPINNPTDDKINTRPENLLPSVTGLTSSETDPQDAEEKVHWTAAAYDPESDQMVYKFLVNGEDQTGWITDNTWTWDNTENFIGDNQIEVRIRDRKHTDPNNFDDHKSVKFTITEPSQKSDSMDYIKETSRKKEKFYLSELGVYHEEGVNKIEYDTLASMKIANIKYNKGIQAVIQYLTEYWYLYFNLNGEYSLLTGLVGMDDANGDRYVTDEDDVEISLTFIGDDIELKTVNLREGDLPTEVEIDVSGVRQFKVRGTGTSNWETIDLIDMELTKPRRFGEHI